MTGLVRLSLRFTAVTLLLVVLLVAGGVFAIASLKQELFPSLDAPVLVVSAVEPGASPETVAADVTTPVEQALQSATDLDTVQSTSLGGAALVVAQYEFGTDMDARAADLRAALDEISLPDGVATPAVQRINPDSFPIYTLAVSGDDAQLVDDYVREQLQPAVEGADGVGEVTVAGEGSRVVGVTLDPAMLAQAGVSARDVTTALEAANLSTPVGGVVADGTQLPVRVATGIDDLDQVREVPVPGSAAPAPGGEVPRLADLGTVELTDAGSGQTLSRTDGDPSVTLSATKDQDANTVDTVAAVEEAVEDTAAPSGVTTSVVLDQAPLITDGISELARDALLGVALAVVAIVVFLRSGRGTLVTGISIPLSLLIAFILMQAQSISLNILTIGALSVAAGRVIDDSIVVFENIHRLLERGVERSRAVIEGTSQMVPAITASTLTTVAVFLPLTFAGGLVGSIFTGFALTVTFALLGSLLVAVTVVPVLAQTFLRSRAAPAHGGDEDDDGVARDTVLRRAYRPPLLWVLRHRALTIVGALLLLAGSSVSILGLNTSLFPASEVTQLQAQVSAPPGTSLQATADQVAEVEQVVADSDGVERYTTVVGSEPGGLASLASGGGGPSTATIDVQLADDADEDASEDLTDAFDAAVDDAGLEGSIAAVGGSPTSDQLSVVVTGRDFDAVSDTAREVRGAMDDVDELSDVSSNLVESRPELVVDVDDAGASAVGLSPTAVAGLLQSTLNPATATTVTLDGDQRDVVVSVDPAAVAGADQLAALPIAPGLTVGDVAEVRTDDAATAVTRTDGDRSAEATGMIDEGQTGAATTAVQDAVDDLDVPDGVDVTVGGAADLQDDSFSSLLVAMLVAVALVYLIMVVAFGSLVVPLVILTTLPLAAIGAFPLLLATGRALDLPALLGVLMLIGIVVTNAIVLLERVQRNKQRGESTHEALVDAGLVRVRPILMTAVVTMLALAPLALGLSGGAILSASLATVVIGGLLSSTLLTLFVIPVVYSLVDGLRRRTGQWQERRAAHAETVAAAKASVAAEIAERERRERRGRERAEDREPVGAGAASTAAVRGVPVRDGGAVRGNGGRFRGGRAGDGRVGGRRDDGEWDDARQQPAPATTPDGDGSVRGIEPASDHGSANGRHDPDASDDGDRQRTVASLTAGRLNIVIRRGASKDRR